MKQLLLFLIALSILTSGCTTTSSDSTEQRVYKFATRDNSSIQYSFTAKTSDPEVIAQVEAQLNLPRSERNMFINGTITRGNDGNQHWSWHFIPDEWDLTEVAIEGCDGTPQFVEDDLDYWVDTIGRFCPWSSTVLQQVDAK